MVVRFPLKVLYFITELDIGGAEQLLLLTLKNINRQKFAPTVCCFYGGDLAGEIEKLGIRVIDLKIRNKFVLSSLFRLYNLLKKEKFDIVHTHLFHANIIGRIAARLCRVPVVISTHHYAFNYNGPLGIFWERLTAGLADRVIVVSEAARRFYLNQVNSLKDKLVLIYNGIDLRQDSQSHRVNLRQQLSLNNDFVIGCIGRFAPVKGQDYLLRAAGDIIKTGRKIKVLLVGSGALEGHLKKIARDLGISEQVIFLESRRDVPAVLEALDLYIQPSLQEGLSIIILEALAMEKPTIASAVGGNAEVIINGESGILVPPRDHKALAEAIINLFENKTLARQLGVNGRLRVKEKFDIKENIRQTESLYEYLIEKNKVNR